MGAFVYALHDKQGMFYIGKTKNARKRFFRYGGKTLNLALKKRLSIAGDDVRVEVLVLNPPDLERTEADLIMVNSGKLLNKQYNRLPLCMKCGEVIPRNTSALKRRLICESCGGHR